MKSTALIWILVFMLSGSTTLIGQIYKTSSASAHFKSDAPLEIIEAKSTKLRGVINVNERTFAFTIPIRSFMGFNSPLQQEHFNENYLESMQYENATFTGKIIEQLDFSKDGKFTVRAKGKLSIHGVTQERIIKSVLEIKTENIYVKSKFTILLDEHKIRVPKIVYQKISKEVIVNMEAIFSLEEK